MLHVFYVNIGQMIKLDDPSLAAGSVSDLQDAIKREINIPTDCQLLLASGGVTMDSEHIVCTYGTGTDTNPVFLFGKKDIDNASSPSILTPHQELPLQDIISRSMAQSRSSHDALQIRTSAAQELAIRSRHLVEEAECLARSQALQGKGWHIVMANLDRSVRSFQTHYHTLKEVISSIQENRLKYDQLLLDFPNDLTILGQLPFFDAFTNKKTEILPGSSFIAPKFSSLLDWIQAQDSNYTLEQLANESRNILSQFHNNEEIKSLMMSSSEIIEAVNNERMRKIRGLDERLRTLHNYIRISQEYLQTQEDLAKALEQQSQQALAIHDSSILTDIIEGHQQQLSAMLANCQQLMDIRDKFYVAKQELSSNIHQRLRWVKSVETDLMSYHTKALLFVGTGYKLQKRFDILCQVHSAPSVYVEAINEVLRRKKYAKQFNDWSSDVSDLAINVRNNEITKRKTFLENNGHHFLLSLFPGMSDVPSSFATKTSPKVDQNLPALEADTISEAIQKFPSEFVSSIDFKDSEILYTSSNANTNPNTIDSENLSSQIKQLTEQLQNTNNEYEIEKSTLKDKVKLLESQTKLLISDNNRLTNANEDVQSQISDAQKYIAQQKSTNDTQDILLNDLQDRLKTFEEENSILQFKIIETESQSSQLSQKTQKMVLQKSMTDEANENLMSENSSLIQQVKMYDSHFGELKGILGDSTNIEQIQSEIKNVINDNANLKISLEQYSMQVNSQVKEKQNLREDLSTFEVEFKKIKNAKELKEKEFEQMALNQNKLEMECLAIESELGLLKEHFEQEMEDKLNSQKTQLDQQHKISLKMETDRIQQELMLTQSNLTDLIQNHKIERQTNWNRKEIQTMKKLFLSSSPPVEGTNITEGVRALNELIAQHKLEMQAKDDKILQLEQNENEMKDLVKRKTSEMETMREETNSKINNLESQLTGYKTLANPYQITPTEKNLSSIISKQPGFLEKDITSELIGSSPPASMIITPGGTMVASSKLVPSTDSSDSIIPDIVQEFRTKLLTSNENLMETSLQESFLSCDMNTITNTQCTQVMTEDFCDKIIIANDNIIKKLQLKERDLKMAHRKIEKLEIYNEKTKNAAKDMKKSMEKHLQSKMEKVQEYTAQLQSSKSSKQSLAELDSFPESTSSSFSVYDAAMDITNSGSYNNITPIHSTAAAVQDLMGDLNTTQFAFEFDSSEPKISLKSFRPGDIVMFITDSMKNYLAYTTGGDMYYMHDESVSLFGKPIGESTKGLVLGRVIDTPECCKICKPSKKRNLPIGSIFYRLKVEKFPLI